MTDQERPYNDINLGGLDVENLIEVHEHPEEEVRKVAELIPPDVKARIGALLTYRKENNLTFGNNPKFTFDEHLYGNLYALLVHRDDRAFSELSTVTSMIDKRTFCYIDEDGIPIPIIDRQDRDSFIKGEES